MSFFNRSKTPKTRKAPEVRVPKDLIVPDFDFDEHMRLLDPNSSWIGDRMIGAFFGALGKAGNPKPICKEFMHQAYHAKRDEQLRIIHVWLGDVPAETPAEKVEA